MSYVPTPDKDGKRKYGNWAGRPNGTSEDPALCVVSVHSGLPGAFGHQCNRKRGHGPDGLYCKQHDPAVVAARNAERSKAYEAKWEKQMRPHRMREVYEKALQDIANGHNAPMARAREALEQFK
jgi:hypothetical protein